MAMNRRDLLKASVVAGAAATMPGCSSPETDSEITETTIAEAEKLLALEYTKKERALAVDSVARQIEWSKGIKVLRFDNSLAPANVLDLKVPPAAMTVRSGVVRSSGPELPLPDNDIDIAFADLTQLSEWIRRRLTTSVRLTEIYLDRLRKHGPTLESVVTLTDELALKQAAQADKEIAAGNYRGPLHGIPWGAKDLLDSKSIRTTYGAAPFKDRVPDRNAAVVDRLTEAGAVLVAKTSLGELAGGHIWFGGRTRNPWNIEEGSRGSSAGSAASTAAGLLGFSIGTETQGSITSPSMRCGTTGLRPTFGRVSRVGAMALSWSMDKIGPICRCVEDTALVLEAINGYDAADADSRDVPFGFDANKSAEGLRIGYSPALFESDEANDIDRRALATMQEIGCELVEYELPDLPYQSMRIILRAEAAAAFEELTLTDRDDELTRQEENGRAATMRNSWLLSAVDLIQAQRLRRKTMGVMDEIFEGVDAIISPTRTTMMLITNMTGHPSLTLRAGFIESATRQDGSNEPLESDTVIHSVPYGVTLWGRLYGEAEILTIGKALEERLDVRSRRPALFAR